MLATFSRVTTLHLARALSTAVNDEAVAAQRELDEFFGAEFTGNAEQSPHANAASMLGGLQAPSPSVNLQTSSDSSAKVNANLSHVDETGRASMVDVGHKASTERVARASALVHVGELAFRLIESNQTKKGDVLSTAQLAGIMGAKQTSSLIPLCHNLFISKSDVQLHLVQDRHAVQVLSEVRTVGQTGVEMEALTAASVAALTVYDMCKAVSKDITITDLKLDFKSGGKSGTYSSADSDA